MLIKGGSLVELITSSSVVLASCTTYQARRECSIAAVTVLSNTSYTGNFHRHISRRDRSRRSRQQLSWPAQGLRPAKSGPCLVYPTLHEAPLGRRHRLGGCQPNFGSRRRVTHLDPGGRSPTEKGSLDANGLQARGMMPSWEIARDGEEDALSEGSKGCVEVAGPESSR